MSQDVIIGDIKFEPQLVEDNRTEKEKWEDVWTQAHLHEPNNRQKKRRMEKAWEKHISQIK